MRWNHAICIVAIVASAAGVEAAAAQPADLAARAEAIVKAAYPAAGPGAAVIITRAGRTVYAGGRGLADLDLGQPITPDTVFRLASISKQFTAALVLQLVQEGRISLDDPISRFFPDYPQPTASATVRQLLNHTSGIPSRPDLAGSAAEAVEAVTNRPYTTAEVIALFRDRPSPAPPGQVWAYSNSGYIMLGAIIEEVTGRPWHQVLEERISRPLGLASIGYGVDRETRPGVARGYTNVDGTTRPAMRIHMSAHHGAGALVGTVGDLARWNQALHGGRVIVPELYRAMTSPATLPEGRTHPYGFGLAIDEIRGRSTVGHGGAIFGFRTDSVYVPSEDLFVAVFANSDDPPTFPSVVAARLAALALGEPYREFTRTDVPQQDLAPLFGLYRIGNGQATRRFYGRGGRLFTMREGGLEMEVFAAADDHFFYGSNSLAWFRIERRPEGNHVMEMHSQGGRHAERAVRTGDEAPAITVDGATLRSYAGRYRTEGPTVTIALGADGVLTVQLGESQALATRPASPTEFLVASVGARIVFHPENGGVNRLVIHQGGRQLEARRAP